MYKNKIFKQIKKSLIFLSIFIYFFSISAYASTLSGFIEGQIWYSKQDLVQGDNVTIYTAIWNGDNAPLQARVEFYDKNVILGLREIIVPKESLIQVSLPWKVTSGDHSISAKIVSSVLVSGTKKETIILDRTETNTDKQFVSVVIKKSDGTNATSSDVIKNEVNEVTAKASEFLPNVVTNPVSNSFLGIEDFRQSSAFKIDKLKKDVHNDIKNAGLDVVTDLGTFIKNDGDMTKSVDPKKENKEPNELSLYKTENLFSSGTPLSYIKLFLLSSLSFIFNTMIVFYFIILLICFKLLSFIFSLFKKK